MGNRFGVPPHHLHKGVALRLVLLLGTHTLRALVCKHEPPNQRDFVSQGMQLVCIIVLIIPASVLLYGVTECNNILLMSSVLINESFIGCLDFM